VKRQCIFQWYHSKSFATRLLDLIEEEQPSEIHENASATWVEFVKALREQRQNDDSRSPNHDPLLDSLQSSEIVEQLLMKISDKSKLASPSLLANGMAMVNALLETTAVNKPSWLLEQDAKGALNSSIDHNGMFGTFSDERGEMSRSLHSYIELTNLLMYHSDPPYITIDAQRRVETLCAERTPAMIRCILDAMRLSSQQTHGDVLSESWQAVIQLVNTNYITAHLELLKALCVGETSLDQLFQAFLSQPMCSIYANYLSTFITYVLYSNTGSSARPLVDYIVRDFNLPKWIRETVAGLPAPNAIGAAKRLELCALRSFCYELANRLVKAQQENAPQCWYIRDLMKGMPTYIAIYRLGIMLEFLFLGMPDYSLWIDFTKGCLRDYVEKNRSTQINNTSSSLATTRSSQNIEIDELGSMPLGDVSSE